MNDKAAAGPPPSLTLADIYYVLFRHKWKIMLIVGVGVLGALLVPLGWSRPYQSEAKLYIRYVLENRSPSQVNGVDAKVKTPDERGENVINTELEILTSLDLAVTVAEEVGPDKILAKLGGGSDRQQAAAVVRGGLLPEVPKNSNVIRLVFKHADPALVQAVLNKLIATYLQKHVEIHRAVGVFDEFLHRETDDLRGSLGQTEESLRKAKTNAQIISLADSKKMFTEQISRIQQAIFDAEAELAERQAAVAELSRLLHAESQAEKVSTVMSNEAPASDKIAEYRRICGLLEGLNRKEQELLVQFTAETSLVKAVEKQIAEAERQKSLLETENPRLLAVTVSESKAVNTGELSLITENARVTALQSKIRVLNTQMTQIRQQATIVNDAEGPITTLERKKELQEAQYKYFQANLEQTQIDTALGASRVSNISVIQAPSPPFRDSSKMRKVMGMLIFGAVGFALALAFVIELYFDRSIRRPSEIEAKIGLPLFVTIPRLHLNGRSRVRKGAPNVPLIADRNNHDGETDRPESASGEARTDEQLAANHHPAVVQGASATATALHPFYEALRDRLILYFEVKNLTHKPKLVAVTSCAPGSGVSTTASGLAATLSETGDGNVLLVDMNLQGEAHQFYRGKLTCDLDDALAHDKRSHALVQENLYVVSETGNGDKLPRVLPNRFKHLVPKLKASDYDYIIFDLPPISQISATVKLARFMDMVFVVLESEKTAADVVKRATGLLSESTANVGIVLNKAKTYVPKQLQQEL